MNYEDDELDDPEVYYCSECDEEVSRRDKVCPFCGADLSDDEDLRELEDEVVELKTFTNDIDAEIARDHLVTAGIKAFISSDDAGGMVPMRAGVRLMVLESEADKAQEVLDAMDIE